MEDWKKSRRFNAIRMAESITRPTQGVMENIVHTIFKQHNSREDESMDQTGNNPYLIKKN